METTKRSQETDQTARQESTNKPQNTQTSESTASKTARERATEEVKEEVKDVVGGAKQKLVDAYDRTATTLNDTYKKVAEYGKENPGKTTLIAFGVGVGVGLLLANAMTPRSRTRRIVPPVMNALSKIAVQLFR